jgi:hypothetical protein
VNAFAIRHEENAWSLNSAPHLPVRFNVRQPYMIGPTVGVDRGLAATMIAAIDQHVADAGGVHLAEGDFLREGCHGCRKASKPRANS